MAMDMKANNEASAASAHLGVFAPFTSPVLVGARLRRDDDGRLPASGPICGKDRDWRDLAGEARVTLHDRLLLRRLAALPGPLTPRVVADIAREIAADGAAGKAAQRAARIAVQEEEEDRLIAQFLLVVSLLEELGVEGCDWRHLSPSDPAFHRWLADSVMQLAPLLAQDHGGAAARSAEWLADRLEQLSAMIAPIGLPGDEYTPRARRMLEDLAAFADDVAAFAATAAPTDVADAARALSDKARTVAGRAVALIAACHAVLHDMRKLHEDWTRIGDQLAARCAEIDFLLDGWPAACLVWREAAANGPAARRAALWEAMLPAGTPGDAPPPPCAARTLLVSGADDPMIVDKIYRNELLRASAP
jgi:hypothetical protein